MWIRALPCVMIAATFALASARAQEGSQEEEAAPRKVIHDGGEMNMTMKGDVVSIAYAEPPAELKEIGVANGQVLVEGTWTKREPSVLVGHAYAFAPNCQPIPYDIRGLVNLDGTLVVMGPTPVFKMNGCEVTGHTWTDFSVMQFMMPQEPREAKSDRKKRKRASAEEGEPKRKAREEKPKERPKRTTERRERRVRPSVSQSPYPQYQSWPQYQQPSPFRW